MRKRVPLNAIRAFEAVARHASVAKAADELCVTPTAVSHQIRLLEDFLQAELFLRRNSRLYLTPGSSANLERISQALDLIDQAVLSMNQLAEDRPRTLSVAASASVASLWLMPRIGRFLQAEPEIDLNLSTFITRKEAEARDCDMRICNWQSQSDSPMEPLMEEEIIPVCSPAFASRFGNDMRAVLRDGTLIHIDRTQMGFDGLHPDWGRYLAEFGLSRNDVMHGPRFNQACMGIDAARSGVGVILGRSLLIAEALDRGDLIAVGEAYPVRSPYFMQLSPRPEGRAILQRFKDWLVESVQPTRMAQVL